MLSTAFANKLVMFSMTSVVALAVGMEARAQNAATPAGGVASTGLGEVVVTARRREERLQDVPVAVTAINPQALQNAQVTTGRQLVQFVPSLNVGTGNERDFQRFTLRGQGVTLGAGEGVAAYINEAPFPQYGAGGPGLYLDLASVQVLNGPQGTLFGRNTTGGAILITPNKPVDYNTGFIQVGAGNYNNHEVTGMVNWAALPGVLDIRIAGEMRQRDGYTQSVITGAHYDDINYQTWRGSISFQPNTRFRNELVVSYNRSKTDGTGFELTDVNPNGATAGFGLANYLAVQKTLGPRKTLATAPGFWFEEDTRVVDTATFELTDNLTLKDIVSYDREHVFGGFDIDGTPAPIVQWNYGPLLTNPSGFGVSKNDYLTQELQLQGKSLDNNLQWTLGGFYEHYYPYGGRQGQDVVEFGFLQQGIFAESSTSQALFGQSTLDFGLFTPTLEKLKLTLGYRYTWDHTKTLADLSALGRNACDFGPGTFPNCTNIFKRGWSAPTYTVGLDYKINPRTLVYFKFSRGYKSGGFNGGANPLLGGRISFAPEYVRDYEIGLKNDAELWGIPLRSDIAVFHDDYTNMQRNQSFVLPGTVPPQIVNVVTNAGAAQIDGVELQFDAKIYDFDVNLNYSYLDARYTNFTLIQPPQTPVAGTNLNGVQLPYAPTHKFGAMVVYHLPVDARFGQISVNVSANYQSSYRWGDLDQPGNILGNYTLVNMGADWDKIGGKPVHLQLFVTNLAHIAPKAGSLAYYYTIGQSAASYIEPRMFGFRLRYDFGR